MMPVYGTQQQLVAQPMLQTMYADNGNYFLIGDDEPTKLAIDIPASDVLNPPWLNVDGSNVTQDTKDAIQGDNEDVLLGHQFRVNVTNVDYYVSFTLLGHRISLDFVFQQVIRQVRQPSNACSSQRHGLKLADTPLTLQPTIRLVRLAPARHLPQTILK